MYNPNHLEDPRDGYLHSGIAPGWEIFSFYIFILSWSLSLITYLIIYHGHFYTILLTFYSPLVRFSGGGECKDPSHFLFSGFVYFCLLDPFPTLPLKRHGVQVRQ